MYKLRGIEKTYKKRGTRRIALKRVDLDLPNSGLFAVTGASGSGKSTLLNVLSCLVLPDKGSIEIDGFDASKFSESVRCGFVARDVGFVFQDEELVSHETLLENMQAALTLAGFSKSEVVKKSNEALESAGLSEFKKCIPEQLSKHQLRKFSIARAMIKGAKVLLFDEPEIGLTKKEIDNLARKIKRASAEALVVVATRDASFAEALGAGIINIEGGVINYTGAEAGVVPVAAGRAGVGRAGVSPAAAASEKSAASKPATAAAASEKARTAAATSSKPAATATSKASKPRAVRVSLASKSGFVRTSIRERGGRSFVLGLSAMLGIIALAFILAITKGITTYIDTQNRDTLSQQPLQVGTLAFNTTELTEALSGDGSTQLTTSELITKTMRTAKNNDLKSFKTHIEDNKAKFNSSTELIDYDYGITPQVFAADTSGGTISLRTSSISDLSSSYTASFTSPAGFTTMARLDAKTSNYTSQYDVLQGRWPQNYNELVLVLPTDRSVPGLDLTSNSTEARLQRFNSTFTFLKTGILSEDKTVESFNFTLQEYMDLNLKLVSVAECYTQNEGGTSWSNNSSDEDFMKNIIANSEDLKIVGVVAPAEDATSETLSSGLWYLPSLEDYIAQRAGKSGVVQAQLANPDVDVFSGIRFDSEGRTFDDLANSVSASINAAFAQIMQQLSTALEQTFADIENELNSLALDEGFELYFASEEEDEDAWGGGWAGEDSSADGSISINWEDILGTTPQDNKVIVGVDESVIDEALLNVFSEYLADATSKGQTPTREGLVNYLAQKDVNEKLNKEIDKAFISVELDDETKKQLNTFVEEQVVPYLLERVEEEYSAYIIYIEAQIKADTYEPLKELEDTLNKLNSEDAFTALGIDAALEDFFKEFDLEGAYSELETLLAAGESEDEAAEEAESAEDGASSGQMSPTTKKFLDLMVKMATTTLNTYSLNLKSLGYSDFSTPSTIRFYTPTYEDRTEVISLINDYNNSPGVSSDSAKHIDFYDLVDTITNISMGVVSVVSLISVVLLLLMGIATTLTIGAITFFSSRDRWRETSIMRILGATRFTVFLTLVLEGAILGLLSAAAGAGIAALLSMPINSSAMESAGFNIMIFEPWHVALLLALGVVAMVVGYLIPAIAISRKDAVSVLRAH